MAGCVIYCPYDMILCCRTGLLPDTQNRGLCMHWECRERFCHHRLQRKLLVSDPGMHHGTCVTHVPWCIAGSLNCGGGEKRSRHSRRMHNSQFYVSGKRSTSSTLNLANDCYVTYPSRYLDDQYGLTTNRCVRITATWNLITNYII